MPFNKPPAKTALVYAVDLLAARPYSTKQLSDKLKRRGYEAEEVEEAIARLQSRRYLDDTDLCQRQCRIYLDEQRRSWQAVKYKLREKGFSGEDIEKALADSGVDLDIYEYNVCLKLLQSHFRPSAADRQKCMAYLYRKGFNGSSIRAAVDDFLADSDKY